jgi:branched-chain amino acid transport system substrate-binding protein
MKKYTLYITIAIMTLIFFIGTNIMAETLKIGIINPLSGPGAEWGLGALRGGEMATEEINADGGLKIGDKIYEVKLIPYDDKYTSKGGVAAAEKLVYRDKVKFIFGGVSSASLLAFQPITEKEKVLVLCNSFSDKAVSPEKPFTLRMLMTSVEGAPLLTDWFLKEHNKVKNVISIAPNDASGYAGVRAFETGFKKHNIKLNSNEYYERGTKDFSPLVTRAQLLNPDAIAMANCPSADSALMVKLFRQMGSKVFFLDCVSLDWKRMIEIAGKEAAEGYMWGAFHDDNDPKIKKFNERYKKIYKMNITTFQYPAFYQAFKAFYYAAEKVKSLDPATVRDAIKYKIPEFEGVMGKMTFGGKEVYGIDNQYLGPYYASTIRNGEQIIIEKLR